MPKDSGENTVESISDHLQPLATPDPSRPGRTISADDVARIRARELGRLRMSLEKLSPKTDVRIAMVHFPPIGADGTPTELTKIMDEFEIDFCVFGHLHPSDPSPRLDTEMTVGKTRYFLVSCDTIGFAPKLIWSGRHK